MDGIESKDFCFNHKKWLKIGGPISAGHGLSFSGDVGLKFSQVLLATPTTSMLPLPQNIRDRSFCAPVGVCVSLSVAFRVLTCTKETRTQMWNLHIGTSSTLHSMSSVVVVQSNGPPVIQTQQAIKEKRKKSISAVSSRHQKGIIQQLLEADASTHSHTLPWERVKKVGGHQNNVAHGII